MEEWLFDGRWEEGLFSSGARVAPGRSLVVRLGGGGGSGGRRVSAKGNYRHAAPRSLLHQIHQRFRQCLLVGAAVSSMLDLKQGEEKPICVSSVKFVFRWGSSNLHLSRAVAV
ncbi:hypothetical protein H103_02284 [Trichophyton rubrum CBS 288.86]|uniref:Uncharacterized protein n=1 Tax=Trichophyton rubrum CBS 288.86 TaxID=1215330 RepID=A0A022W9L6_TRIRU|nr:hypothetical protein H103_02284 [Trichophyton rubrum CBS 288.86]EZF86967.1 hypothetical protein H110_02279 [Trichophyton rubrum MR1448]EZG08672.1 hypothetical protein H106_02145 [Trichophyton rubrum CBS 735.88]